MRKLFLAALLTSFVFFVPLNAQMVTPFDSLEDFKAANPKAMFLGQQYFDGEGFIEQVGTADTIYGSVLSTGSTPLESAWNFYRQIEGIYADRIGELVPVENEDGVVLQGVMWDKQTNTHRLKTFRFNQMVGGIPVFRSGIGFLVRNEDQFPVVMSSNNLKEMNGFDTAGLAFIAPNATDTMIENTGRLMDVAPPFEGGQRLDSVLDNQQAAERPVQPIKVTDERLVIWSGVTNVKVAAEPAIVFMAERGSIFRPERFAKQLVVAAVDDGAILYSENQVHADVDGTVSGQASSDGVSPLECTPASPFALPYAQVQVVGGQSTFADENGAFDIVDGTNGNVTVRSRLQGEFFEVFDDSIGGAIPFIDIDVSAPGSVDILHNSNPSEFGTSNINCYLHANIIRDFVLGFEPTYPIIANQTGFNVTTNHNNFNGATSCNAFYTGDAINFIRNAGSCVNTSIPDVVYHEYGHHLIAVTGNGQGQIGEGTGDTMGVLLQDNPEGGEGWTDGDCSSFLRSAENFRSYPCSGGIHDCGQLISGCVWDTINEIRTVDSENAVDITAGLFVGMLIVRGQMVPGNSTIDPLITSIFLELDDDDGDLANGTPHSLQILFAFGGHEMLPAEFEMPLEITFPIGLPDFIQTNGGTTLQVDVAPLTSSPVNDSGILHVNHGNGFEQFPMTQIDSDSYTAEFPSADCLSVVEYFVTIDAVSGVRASNPQNAPSDAYDVRSASQLIVAINDSFDADMGWTESGDASDGQWERGIPNNGDRGDPADDAEDNGAGFCFVTDNGNTQNNDNTDVDNGSTILTSPVFDASTTGEAYISFYRWYSNNFGDDIFVADISNDGGANWTNLESIGPAGIDTLGGWRFQEYLIADILEPTNNMRVRFIASDNGGAHIVEAGIDQFIVRKFECGGKVILGDVNQDGFVDLLDVAPFVALLSNGDFQAEADINGDGSVDLLDVAPFVDLIIGE